MYIQGSLRRAYSIRLADIIMHPVFGQLRVDGIFRDKYNEDYDMYCVLLDFNGTIRVFKGIELIRISQRRRTRLKIIK